MIKKISISILFAVLLVLTGCEKCTKPEQVQDPFVNAPEYVSDDSGNRSGGTDGFDDGNSGSPTGNITDPNEDPDFDGIVDPDEDPDFDLDGK